MRIIGTAEPERHAVLAAIAATGLIGATLAQIGVAANLDEAAVRIHVGELIAAGRVRSLTKPPAFIATGAGDDLLARTTAMLEGRQRERPWNMGATSLGLAHVLALPEAILIRVLASYVETGALVYRGGYYATTDFQPRLTPEQRAFFDRAFGLPGLTAAPVAFEELRALIRSSAVPELSQAFETLVAVGALAKVGDLVYLGSQIAAIRAQLESALRQQRRITVAEFRTLTGTSRKYAVPLLEFFDATGVTLRTGDWRVLRPPAAHRT